MDSKFVKMLIPSSKKLHMFFYNGTCMTMPSSMDHQQMTSTMEQMFESLKKDMVLNRLETTTENIKTECEYFLEKINTQLLASDGKQVTCKKMRKAWGKDASFNEIMWCAYVWVLENKCGVPSTNTFGYLRMGVDDKTYEEMTVSKPILKCGNPSCNYRYPSMMKCSVCKKEHYCSSECQKIHWKTHKKVCGK